MTILRMFTAILALMGAMALPAQADPFDEVAQVELIPGWRMADGSHMAGLKLTLAPGWKTYWRAPGDAGIPPQFSWRGSSNLAGVTPHWPTPEVFSQNGMRSVGYSRDMILPLHVTTEAKGKDVRLKGRMEIGICLDICIPRTLTFRGMLPAEATQTVPAIAAAMADTPYSAEDAEVSRAICTITPLSDGLQVEATIDLPHTGGTEFAVIETGNPALWVSEAETTRRGNRLTAISRVIHAEALPFILDRSQLRMTVIGTKYAVDIQGCTAR